MMKRWMILAALTGFFAAGCAGIIEFQRPKEFDGKKQVEDPPISRLVNVDGVLPV